MGSYYTSQGDEIANKLQEGMNVLNDQLKVYIDAIKEELIKTNDSTAEGHISKCDEMSSRIQEDFIKKIEAEIKFVQNEAAMWQDGYDKLKEIEGDHGFDWASGIGFNTYTKTKTITDSKTGEDIVITIYIWDTYENIAINGSGYVDFSCVQYSCEGKSGQGKEVVKSDSITITHPEQFEKYLFGRFSYSNGVTPPTSGGGDSAASAGGNSPTAGAASGDSGSSSGTSGTEEKSKNETIKDIDDQIWEKQKRISAICAEYYRMHPRYRGVYTNDEIEQLKKEIKDLEAKKAQITATEQPKEETATEQPKEETASEQPKEETASEHAELISEDEYYERLTSLKSGEKLVVFKNGKKYFVSRNPYDPSSAYIITDEQGNVVETGVGVELMDVYNINQQTTPAEQPKSGITPTKTFDYDKIRAEGTKAKDGSIVLSTGPGDTITLFPDGSIETYDTNSDYSESKDVTTVVTTIQKYDQNGILVTTKITTSKHDRNTLIEMNTEIYDANNNLISSIQY